MSQLVQSCEQYLDSMGNVFNNEKRDQEDNHQSQHSELSNELLVSWHSNIDEVDNTEEDSPMMLYLLPDEKTKVKRFKFIDDQKRALLSILLQRSLIRGMFNVSDEDYELQRTREGKPIAVSSNYRLDFKTWNFNVSHHGKFVSIVAHPSLLVGVDIVDLSTRSNMSKQGLAMDFVEIFEPQLTLGEMDMIRSQLNEDARYSMFYILWSLKEAYIKAIGQGLGYDLKQVEFEVTFESQYGLSDSESGMLKGAASVRVNGILRDDWRMDFESLDNTHVMTVSRGPLSEALPTYRAQAGWKVCDYSPDHDIHSRRLTAPVAESQYKALKDLYYTHS